MEVSCKLRDTSALFPVWRIPDIQWIGGWVWPRHRTQWWWDIVFHHCPYNFDSKFVKCLLIFISWFLVYVCVWVDFIILLITTFGLHSEPTVYSDSLTKKKLRKLKEKETWDNYISSNFVTLELLYIGIVNISETLGRH